MIWIWVARCFFAPLSVFELLNALGVLHFTLAFTWWGLVITCIPVWVALEVSFYHYQKRQLHFPWWVIVPVILAVYFDALGDIAEFYNNFLWWDQVAHAMGSIAIACWVGAIVLPVWKVDRLSSKYRFLFLMSFSVFLGVVYEMAEYFEDLISSSRRLGDGFDTVNDLLWDTFGAVLVGALLPKLHISTHHDRRSYSKTQNS